RIDHCAVDCDDFAGNRRVDIGCRFDRFHHGARFSRADLAADPGKLDEHEVAERLLRMIGNADGQRAVRFGTDPFVTGGVPETRRNVHGLPSVDEMRIAPLRTNGGFTTLASSALSRTSTRTLVPGAMPIGTRASAMERPKVGEKLPLVTSPSPRSVRTF